MQPWANWGGSPFENGRLPPVLAHQLASARLLFQGGDLYHAIEKVRWLIRLMALRELGFDDEALKKLALRNKKFTFLRSS